MAKVTVKEIELGRGFTTCFYKSKSPIAYKVSVDGQSCKASTERELKALGIDVSNFSWGSDFPAYVTKNLA